MTKPRRICILADGRLDVFTAKTAMGVLRYCPDEVVAVLDRAHAGQDLFELVGTGKGVPIVDSIAAAAAFKPDQLIIGVALPGGNLPSDYRQYVLEALAAGMDVINGLHTRLNQDAGLLAAAQAAGRRLVDVRMPPAIDHVGNGKARTTRGKRVLTVGTDCNLGKRVTASELVAEINRRGLNGAFVPTGQTGVMIAGWGVAIDGVVSDFVSGFVEDSVLKMKDADYIVIEGQGSIIHPGYSAVTLGLMHGALPDYFVVCHAPAREFLRHTDVRVAEPQQMIEWTEALLAPIHPAKCLGVALNCHGLAVEDAAKAHERIAAQTGLPVVDSLKTGVGPLVDALIAAAAPGR